MGTLLRTTTDDISAENPDITGYGTGRLNAGRAVAYGSRIRFSPLVLRFTGPGVRFSTNAGDTLLAFANEGGRLLFLDAETLALQSARYLNGIPTGGIAAADLGQSRGLGLFLSIGSQVLGLGAAGEPLPGWPVEAPISVDPLVGTPLLADLDGDGSPEILCVTASQKICAWRANGSVFPNFFPNILIPTPPTVSLAAANIDGRPGAEILAAGSNGALHVLRANGTELPGWPVYVQDSGISAPVVAIGADGDTTIVVAGLQSVRGFHTSGQLEFQTTRANHQVVSDPALGDLDGDGVVDVVIVSPASVEAFDLEGRPLPGWPASWQATIAAPPIIGPFAASDTLAVVAHDGAAIRAWSGSGRPLTEFPPLAAGGPTGGLTLLAQNGAARLVVGAASDGTCYAYDGAAQVTALPVLGWPTPGGNFARTGSRLSPPAQGVGDVLPPAPISDLGARPFGGAAGILLTWTAPADTGPAGKSADYDVRFARFAQSLTLAPTAQPRILSSIPRTAGQPESLFAAGLPSYANYFAVRSRDASGNWSAFSEPVARQGFDPVGDHGGVALELGRNPSPPPFPFFWEGTALRAGSAIRIYDVGGRLVRKLALGAAASGITYWDGADENGHTLGAGVYVATLGHDAGQVKKRFVLLH